MGGSATEGKTETQRVEQARTDPYGPSQPYLNSILTQAGSLSGNAAPTAADQSALATMRGNAASLPSYAPQTRGLISDLFAGGTDRTGILSSAYNDYKTGLTPFAAGNFVNPASNPALQSYLDVSRNDVGNDIRSRFAAAGRDFSGMEDQTLARGITQAEAPILASQYNTERANQLGALSSLFGAGVNTAQGLNALDQTALGNRANAIGVAQMLPGVQNIGPQAMIDAENSAYGLPLQRLGMLSSIVNPIAGLGSSSTGVRNETQTQQVPWGPMVIGGLLGAAGLGGRLLGGK